jgi:hypothetical protein
MTASYSAEKGRLLNTLPIMASEIIQQAKQRIQMQNSGQQHCNYSELWACHQHICEYSATPEC